MRTEPERYYREKMLERADECASAVRVGERLQGELEAAKEEIEVLKRQLASAKSPKPEASKPEQEPSKSSDNGGCNCPACQSRKRFAEALIGVFSR